MKIYIGKLSLIATLFVSSSVFAGKIVTDADLGGIIVTPNKQYGFGGWNLENVNVKITKLPDYRHNIGSFDTVTGVYSQMGYGYTFESDIIGAGGSIVGRLHGKDWPVGEPSGVKVINGDSGVTNGKPENCIMTTSYLAGAYLDAVSPRPNICSGPFQSHKRFKIDLQSGTYQGDNLYGKSVEMTFNLQAGDRSTKRYQIVQKINNHTGKRLNGYQIEVLDANKQINMALTLSLGQGENSGSDIWDIDELANISHGLWGPVDDHFPKPGFFDNKRAYYPVSLVASNKIAYLGSMQGGNYQALFGNWLPSKWHPMGIFFDHDNNPATDSKLLAFWGDPLNIGTNNWHKGFQDGFVVPTEEELSVWTQKGGLYQIAGLEDSVNLGLNYIVNIGNNAAIGSTFTIRITPHFAPSPEQGIPSYVLDAPEPNHPGSERPNPDDGGGSVAAYDSKSLLFMIFGFLTIGMLIARRRLV